MLFFSKLDETNRIIKNEAGIIYTPAQIRGGPGSFSSTDCLKKHLETHKSKQINCVELFDEKSSEN